MQELQAMPCECPNQRLNSPTPSGLNWGLLLLAGMQGSRGRAAGEALSCGGRGGAVLHPQQSRGGVRACGGCCLAVAQETPAVGSGVGCCCSPSRGTVRVLLGAVVPVPGLGAARGVTGGVCRCPPGLAAGSRPRQVSPFSGGGFWAQGWPCWGPHPLCRGCGAGMAALGRAG